MMNLDRRAACGAILAGMALPGAVAAPQTRVWKTSWAASAHGPFPSGSAVAMPDQSFSIPSSDIGAVDQSFRLILRPSVWGPRLRLRLSNTFGSKPVTFDGLYVGLQKSSAALVAGTNRPVHFGGAATITIAPGGQAWSDPVALPFVTERSLLLLAGRKLAVSYHVAGESGPITWHAKGMQTSYASAPHAGSKGQEQGEASFPYSQTAWFFLDAVDMSMPADTALVVCLGDSITDGTGSTLNGDDRWPDDLQRRLDELFPNRVAVVDAGIGGNQVLGPASYSLEKPFSGGPAALQRLDRDVTSLSGVNTVIWFEGINDTSARGTATAADVIAGLQKGVALLRQRLPGVRVVGATITSAVGTSNPSHGTPEEEAKRHAINDFIRSGDLYDSVLDFDRAVLDSDKGGLKAQFVPNSTGGKGDRLHPNRAGYLAMVATIDPAIIVPRLMKR